jgi:hypothetical protein
MVGQNIFPPIVLLQLVLRSEPSKGLLKNKLKKEKKRGRSPIGC